MAVDGESLRGGLGHSAALPQIVDSEAWERFGALVRERLGADPENRWYGGYVAHEWDHLRHALLNAPMAIEGADLLEFGCNVGGSAVVAARLGAKVTGVDVNPDYCDIATANIAAHGLEDRAAILHCPDTRQMPFETARFDLIIANSVLEYVPPAIWPEVAKEIDRVLRPGGVVMVMGTASRLALQEVHSGRWLVNYLPREMDRLVGREYQRGMSPLALIRGFRGYRNLELEDHSARYLKIREAYGWPAWARKVVGVSATILAPVGISPALLMRNMTATLQKPR
ncbi:MAG: class I SAM-dependent methyltransferase [Neomegalonema sp.]|nr:class I SAM-dependent methyltransferase [Neomegalonema sp.]